MACGASFPHCSGDHSTTALFLLLPNPDALVKDDLCPVSKCKEALAPAPLRACPRTTLRRGPRSAAGD